MGLLDLFTASSMPVLKVLIVTAVGSFLATDRVNLLGEDARKYFNNVVFYVLTPPLIGTNLSKTITYDSLISLWFMPVNILITFIIGSALGWIVAKLTKAPSNLRGLIVGCCAGGNLGNLLIIIVPAVCKEKGSPFGDPEVCHTYAMAYASLSMAIGAIFLWVYVYNIVRISSTTRANEVEANVSSDSVKYSGENPKLFPESYTEALLVSKDCSISNDYADQVPLPISRSSPKVEVPISVKFIHQLKIIAEKIDLKRLFAPSTIGSIIGFVVGVVPQIRKLMIGESAPLRVIQDSASLLGDGAIPVLTLLVGGNLIKGLKGPGIQKSIIVGIVVVRFILLPLVGIVIVKGAISFGLINSDPLYHFILMLQFALPPALNIGTMTQLFGAGESECSVILLWTYALASVFLTFWSTVFMWLLS